VRWRHAATAALAAGVILATARAAGGFFPTSWGWTGLALLAALAVVLLAAHVIETSRLELAFVGLLVGFVAWVALSTAWTLSVTRTVLEVERDLVYVAAAAALLALAPRRSSAWILAAVLVASAGVCADALTHRVAVGGRLAGPVGYWNALGLVCAVGAVLALGLATAGGQRALAAASAPLFVATLYLTYSRGSIVVLALGVLVSIALSPGRGRLAATAAVLAVPCALAAVVAARWDGARFRLGLVLLAAAAAVAPSAVDAFAARVRVSRRTARIAALAAAGVALVVVAAGVARAGGLGATASRAYRSFTAAAPKSNGRGRSLLSVSGAGRADYWRVALQDFGHRPLLGSGAGTFTLEWDRRRHTVYDVVDAHSLYLEVLAELGPLGLLLIGGALAVPLATLRRRGVDVVGASAAGAYVAFLVHAGIDWDWEVPTVTLCGLACGAALLVRRDRPLEVPIRARAAALGAAAVVAAFVGWAYVGNRDLSHATRALDAGAYPVAADDARRAAGLLRWSADPWHLRGDADRGLGLRDDALRSYRRAVALDPHDWRLWYELGQVSSGAEQARAYAIATRLNPLAKEILGLKGR
jgi:hypothetical protein